MSSENADEPTEQETNRTGRDGHGRYTRTIDTAGRDAKAARLRADGWEYRDIGRELGFSASNAYEAVQRVLKETVVPPAEDLRREEVERLNRTLRNLTEMRDTVLGVLARKHYAISNGKLMYLGSNVLEDDDVVLRAVAQLGAIEDRRTKVGESRRKLLGLDIPVKQEIEIGGGVEYRIVGVDAGALQ